MESATTHLSKSCILVIDDDRSIVDQLLLVLEKAGYVDVRSTTRPSDALSLVREFQPDLVMMDLQMPVMNGFEVLSRLNAELPPDEFLPVIVFSSDITPEAREKAVELGARDFIAKPFDYGEVKVRVRNLLDMRRLQRQLRDRNRALGETIAERTAALTESLGAQRRLQDQLMAQGNLQALGQMASGIAHDFNNAVSVIMGHSEVFLTFQDMLNDREELLTSFKIINDAARDATHIVSRLREFYNPARDPFEPSSADLKEAVNSAIDLTSPKWREQARAEGREISIETECSPFSVSMALSDLREILTNLIFNAVDAMPAGGCISISARTEGGYGVLTVTDNGIGMDDQTRNSCLEMFFTTKGERGTGLGLGMVADQVSRHRGTIEIESEPGLGTTFTIRIPLADPSLRSSSEKVGRLDRALHILVVDDEASVREMLVKCLKRDGHTVVTAGDGRDALSKFFAQHFDLIITDHAMPRVNGEQLTRAIRNNAPDQPVFAVSGFDSNEIESLESLKRLATRTFRKPAPLNELRKAMLEVFQGGADQNAAID